MNANAIVFIGMVYPWGLIRHFALLGIELAKVVRNADYYFASISREPNKGTWRHVRQMLPESQILEKASFGELVAAIDTLFARYGRVLVHCGGGWGQSKALIPLRKKYGKRLVLVGTTHSFHIESWKRIPMSLFQCLLYLRYYDKIVFQCSFVVKQFWGARLLFAMGKGAVIPLGCEPFDSVPEKMPPGIAGNSALAEALGDPALFKFVYLAGFRPGKMHAWLVETLTPVLKEHPEARVLFCGTGDQSVIDKVRTVIARQNVQDQVIMTGQIPREEVPWLLLHANCAIVPSRAETFGHNFLEPMFAGLPVLGTRVGVGRDIIKDGETGYGFSLSKPASAQDAARVLLKDVGHAHEMGKRAKCLVKCDYTHAEVARRLAVLYDELLGWGSSCRD